MRSTTCGISRRSSRLHQFVQFTVLVAAMGATSGARAQGLAAGTTNNDFGSANVGGTATTETLQFTVAAGASANTLAIVATTEGAPALDYKITAQTCAPQAFVGPANCSVTVSFVPTQRGLRRGAITITQTGGPSATAYLHGIGLGSQVVFSPDTAIATSTVTPLLPVFYAPSSLVFDGAGNMYFNDFLNARIIEQSSAGTLSTLSSLTGTIMQSIAINGAGTFYISGPAQGKIYTLVPGGTVTALPIAAGILGQPSGIAIDGSGFVYVADAQKNRIMRLNPDGSNAVALALTGLATPLQQPEGLAFDPTGASLYVVDSGNTRVVRIALGTLAAAPVTITGGLPYNPYGIAVDASGTLYIADTGNRRVLRVLPTGAAASVLTPSFSFSVPTGIVVAANGDLLVADNNNGLVRIQRATPTTPIVFSTSTPVGSPDAADGTKFVTLANIGNLPLQVAIPAAGGANPSTTNAAFTVSPASTCPLPTAATPAASAQVASGSQCTYGVTFTPTVAGPNTGNLQIQTVPTGAAAPVTATVPLSGNGNSTADGLTLTATPNPVQAGMPLSLTVTATMAGVRSASYRGTVTIAVSGGGPNFPSGTTYIFTAADAGAHTFPTGVILTQPGTFTVTVSDGALRASVPVTVTPLSVTPAITLASSVNPVLVGGSTLLSATVTPPGGGAFPTGLVTFFDGANPIATAALVNGAAAASAIFNTIGTHTLTAQYNGGAGFNAATSAPVAELVGDFTFALTGTGNVASVYPGNDATFPFSVSPVGTPTLAGPVSFTATGLPANTVITFTPGVVPAGSATTAVTMTVNVPAGSASMRMPGRDRAPVVFALLLLPLAAWRRRRRLRALMLSIIFLGITTGLTGCLTDKESGYFGTTPHTYTISVVATSGAVTHAAAPITLTVE